MDNLLIDELIKILNGIKETNRTMEMGDVQASPDFERDWYRPAEREQDALISKLISTIKQNVDSIAWKD